MSYLDDLLESFGGLLGKQPRQAPVIEPDRPSAPDRITGYDNQGNYRFVPDAPIQQEPTSLLGKAGQVATNLWHVLPPEVRQSYASAPQGIATLAAGLSPGAAIKDTMDESGNMVKALQEGRLLDAGAGPAKMAVAMAGIAPPVRAVREAQTIVREAKAAAKVKAPWVEPGLLSENIPRAAGDPRISTRVPSAVKRTDDPLTSHLSIGLPEIMAAPNVGDITSVIRRYPGFGDVARIKDPAERAEAYVQRGTDNLRALTERLPESIIERAPNWYPGANKFNVALANRYGLPEPSVHGATASLSPQKDWFQNGSLSERTADIMHNQANFPMSSEMRAKAREIDSYNTAKAAPHLEEIMGKKFSDLDNPLHQAMWLRLYDEAHNPRHYRLMSPEGNLGDFVRNADGSPARVAWGSFGEIGKAIQSLQSGGDTNLITGLLGGKGAHKVPDFYNNMAVPKETRFPGDVTSDTHNVAAVQLRPLSGNTEAVAHNFGNSLDPKYQVRGHVNAPSSIITGISGTYGLNVEPLRRVSKEYGLLPNQMQSVDWEGIRSMFPDTFKTDANMRRVDAIHRAADKGEITRAQARNRIFKLAGPIKEPDWAQPGGLLSGPQPTSTYR